MSYGQFLSIQLFLENSEVTTSRKHSVRTRVCVYRTTTTASILSYLKSSAGEGIIFSKIGNKYFEMGWENTMNKSVSEVLPLKLVCVKINAWHTQVHVHIIGLRK